MAARGELIVNAAGNSGFGSPVDSTGVRTPDLLNDGAHSYTYDANGQRVRKTTGAASCTSTTSGTKVDYLYDLEGHQVSEVSAAGAWNRGEVYAGGRHLATYSGGASGATYFIHADWLGTERARSTVAGAVCETMTSLPFGDGLATNGSCGDPSPLHFTGKQHDAETNLDDFGARYYSSSFGRFMTIDPVVISKAKTLDPQQLNAYAYARGNPLRFLDPDGQEINLGGLSEGDRKALIAQFERLTGLTLHYNPQTGKLEVVGDPSKVSGGSATFRNGLLAAIGSKDVFNVLDRTEYKGQVVSIGLYDKDAKTVVLDFKNIASVEQNHPDDVNLGTSAFHELVGHGVEGLPDTQPLWFFWRDTALDRENQVRKELGMYIRNSWEPTQCGGGSCTIWLYKNMNNGVTDNHFVKIPVGKKE
jgi:RHS repeat-associated protein